MLGLRESSVLALAISLGACASAPPQPLAHAAAPVPAELTLARELLASLPAGAQGCVVAWPGRLSERRRRLLARVSAARGFPFVVPEVPSVYAEAFRYRPDGGVSSVMTWAFAGSRAGLRRFIETRAPLATRFEREDDGDTSAYAAHFVGPHQVLLRRGAWPASAPVGVEGECERALAGAVAQGAYELSVEARGGAPARAFESDTAPERVTTRILPAHEAVRVYRTERYDRPSAAGDAVESLAEPGAPLDDVLGPARAWRASARRVRRERRVRFDDLVLLAQDDADRRRVMGADQRARSPLPVERARVEDRDALEQQLTLRRIQLELVPPAQREAQRGELLELLRRGREAHPLDPTLALPYARLALELHHDYEAALEAIDALGPAGVVDPRALDPVRHEALSYASQARLAAALVEDLALPSRLARKAAQELIAARRAGTAYEAAEGLWLAQHALLASSLRASGRAPRGLSWPLASLPETAAALIDQAGLERPLYVVARAAALRGDAGSLPEALGRYATLHLSDATTGVWVLGATTHGELSLARLGALLDSHVSSGELDLMVAIVRFGQEAARPEAWLHLVGRVHAGRVEVTRLGLGGAPEVEWFRVAPLLADPLATAGTRVFPAPTLDLTIADPERALGIAQTLRSVASCSHTPVGLACRPRAERGAISRALGQLCRSGTP